MLYFIDCEFIERTVNGVLTLELISIGIVSEDNRELYLINSISRESIEKANEWVKRNVLNTLYDWKFKGIRSYIRIKPELKQYYKSINQIKQDILDFVAADSEPKFWGEWSSYDWCCLCSCFGSMIDLPSNFPMRCRDIIQLAEDHLNISSNDLPESLEVDGNHNALLGAKSVKMRYEWLLERVKEIKNI